MIPVVSVYQLLIKNCYKTVSEGLPQVVVTCTILRSWHERLRSAVIGCTFSRQFDCWYSFFFKCMMVLMISCANYQTIACFNSLLVTLILLYSWNQKLGRKIWDSLSVVKISFKASADLSGHIQTKYAYTFFNIFISTDFSCIQLKLREKRLTLRQAIEGYNERVQFVKLSSSACVVSKLSDIWEFVVIMLLFRVVYR